MQVPANKTVSLFFAITMVGLMLCTDGKSQGRVIINEFNDGAQSCNGGAHFIELYNLGPGVQNISCYKIVTNNYTITIPNNAAAILNPGETYLIAGASQLTGCGKNNAPITANVDLNWNSQLDCIYPGPVSPATTIPINGFFYTTSNNKSYPVVLYNSSFTLVDAVRTPGSTLETGTIRNNPTVGSACVS